MKKILIILTFITSLFLATRVAIADTSTQTAINNAINYLGTQLNGATGQIQQGNSISDPSPWAAIAFSANGINPSTVKTSTNAPSLIDYLQNNPPTTTSVSTEWEKWILAITASGQDPTNFAGQNFVTTLESSAYYNGSQFVDNNNNKAPDTISLSYDWFGAMALMAGGVDKTNSELINSLSFILANQNCDGGFGYAVGATSDGDDTSAAIQALVDAKIYGVNNPSLDNAISNAKSYLLSTQDSSTGGFLYDLNDPYTTGPDTDSTTWALMALNALGMQSSASATSAKTWLISQQSSADSGILSTYSGSSDAVTTSHALIGLVGKGWVTNITYNILNLPDAQPLCASTTPTPTPTITVTPTITPTPTSTSNVANATPTPTPTFAPTPTPTVPSATPTQTVLAADATITSPTTSPSPFSSPTNITQEVLGAHTKNQNNPSFNIQLMLTLIFFSFGIISLGLYGWQKLKH